jgi:hypothetical protein
MPSTEKAFMERVRFICELYEGANYVLGDTLEEKYANKLRDSFQLAAGSVIFAFLDTTPIGHWKRGAVICTEGVLFKTAGSSATPPQLAIDWKTMHQLPDPELISNVELSIGDDPFVFELWNSSFPADRLARLLCDLHDGLQEYGYSEPAGNPADQVKSPLPRESYATRVVDL